MCLYTMYYVYIIVQFCAHRSMKCYRSPMTYSIKAELLPSKSHKKRCHSIIYKFCVCVCFLIIIIIIYIYLFSITWVMGMLFCRV